MQDVENGRSADMNTENNIADVKTQGSEKVKRSKFIKMLLQDQD